MAIVQAGIPYDEDLVDNLLVLIRFADQLPRIVEAASLATSAPNLSAIANQVSSELNLSSEDVQRILESLWSSVRMQTRMGNERAFDAFTLHMEEYARLKRDEAMLGRWQSSRGRILEALRAIGPDHPLSLLRKAEQLFYSHQGLLGEARIITDLRPVFDRSGEKILRLMVTHSLILEYYDGGASRRLELGIDSTDLAFLRSACERAEVKAITLKEALKDKPWPTTLGLDDAKPE